MLFSHRFYSCIQYACLLYSTLVAHTHTLGSYSCYAQDIALLAESVRQHMQSESKDMSKASYQWSKSLLDGLSIDVQIDRADLEASKNDEPPPYNWAVETTKDTEIIDKGEPRGIPDAAAWFTKHFLARSRYSLEAVMIDSKLPLIRGNGKRHMGRAIFASEFWKK